MKSVCLKEKIVRTIRRRRGGRAGREWGGRVLWRFRKPGTEAGDRRDVFPCGLEEVASGENRKKRKTSIHGACSANRPAKSRAVMMRVDL